MDKIVIAVDAMGGDLAPVSTVEGALLALNENPEIELQLYGDCNQLEKALANKVYDHDRLKIIATSQIVDNSESPTAALRKKKDSSLVRGLQSVADGQAVAFVSAGSTGAVLAGGTLLVGRIEGIKRPALAVFFPTPKEPVLVLDIGANVDCKPEFLLQFGQMGSAYYQAMIGKSHPRVGLLNNGAEAGKGSRLTKESYSLLADSQLNFIGNVEARQIHSGQVDVVVCDGFAGNVILKYAEGLSGMIFSQLKQSLLSSTLSKLGALFIKKPLKKMVKQFDYKQYGGVPLLGLKGLVVKAHGSSDGLAFKNAILQCYHFGQSDGYHRIKQSLELEEGQPSEKETDNVI